MNRDRLSRLLPWTTVLTTLLGCSGPNAVFQAAVPIDLPEPEAVDAVVFLVGDAGQTAAGRSPLLNRLSADVEGWTASLASDSAVTVVFLGDNVYPVGVRNRSHPDFAQDSIRLWNQISVLAGEEARLRGSRGVFLAGNHDWGNMVGTQGLLRLRNQQAMLDSARAQGIRVELVPPAGHPGPEVQDVRENIRMMFIDTHWFLQTEGRQVRTDFFNRMLEAMEEAGERHVIIAAHHPYVSAGPHGHLEPGAKVMGLLYLMKKSGTLVQDLNSPIYDELLTRLRLVFRTVRSPLIFAGGHDHSLQVLDGLVDEAPEHILVSGSGSKLTPVTRADQLRYAASLPGYMVLVFRQNEAVDLFVLAGNADRMQCPASPEEDRATCMAEATAEFRTVYSERLAPEASLPDSLRTPEPQ